MRTVVVGASSGLGRCIGIGLAQRGDQVALLARRRSRLEDAAKEAGPGTLVIECDVTDEASCRSAIEEAAAGLGGIDALVYAPGIGPLVKLVDTDADTWRRVFDTNVTGAALVTAAAVPNLAASSGAAMFLSSVSASQTPPWPGLGSYAVSKAALDKLVEAWRAEHPDIGFTRVRAGVIFQPTAAQSYYLSYGTSFNPSLETLALTSGQQSLEPETSAQYELGGKWDVMEGNLSLTAAIFQIEKDNTRSQISTGVYELTGNVRVQGFQATAAGRLTPLWQVFAGYTYLDAEIVKASVLDGTQGKVPANTPKDSASFWTTYRFAREWQAGTGVAYMSDRFASNNNAVRVPSYLRWDAMVAYEQPKYSIQLNIFNLANRLNYDALIPSDRGSSVPGTDRQALLSVTYKFI